MASQQCRVNPQVTAPARRFVSLFNRVRQSAAPTQSVKPRKSAPPPAVVLPKVHVALMAIARPAKCAVQEVSAVRAVKVQERALAAWYALALVFARQAVLQGLNVAPGKNVQKVAAVFLRVGVALPKIAPPDSFAIR